MHTLCLALWTPNDSTFEVEHVISRPPNPEILPTLVKKNHTSIVYQFIVYQVLITSVPKCRGSSKINLRYVRYYNVKERREGTILSYERKLTYPIDVGFICFNKAWKKFILPHSLQLLYPSVLLLPASCHCQYLPSLITSATINIITINLQAKG